MGKITMLPIESSYWDDKKLLPHPSDTPPGHRFLFTHSEPNGRIITGETGGKTVTDDKGNAYTIDAKPTHWTNFYNKYDVYEKGEPNPPVDTEIGRGLIVTTDLIKNGFTIPDDDGEVIAKTPYAYIGKVRAPFICSLNGRVITILGLENFYSQMLHLHYYVRK